MHLWIKKKMVLNSRYKSLPTVLAQRISKKEYPHFLKRDHLNLNVNARFMPASLYNFKERHYITLILLILLGGFIAYSIRGIFGALLGTIVMYTIFRPLHFFLLNQWHWRPHFSAIFIIVGSFILIVLPFLGLGSMIMTRITSLQENQEWIKATIYKINEFAGDKYNTHELIDNYMKEGIA